MIRRLLPLMLLAAAPLTAQQREVRAMRAAPDAAIRLWIPAGMVEVEGWDHDSVEVRATAAKGVRFDGGGSPDAVKFALEKLRTTDTLLPSAQLRVFVPRGARVWIKSTTAAVEVRGMAGELDVLQVTGRTVVRDAGGVVSVESIDGAILVARPTGVVRIRGGSGSARVEEASGTIDVSLVSGNLLLTKNTRWSASATEDPGPPLQGRVETVSGKVYFLGSLGAGGRLEVATHDGLVDLQLVGVKPPRVETAVASATVAPALRGADPRNGHFVLRSFKGAVNAAYFSGI